MEYHNNSAHPHWLGMKHWDEVPKDPAEVEEWLQRTRVWVEEKMASVEAGTSMPTVFVTFPSNDGL